MKLFGSKTEEDYRKRLISSHQSVFNESRCKRLLNVLRINFQNMKTAYCLNHIPEQGEDFYTMLVNTDIIAEIEINRDNEDEKPIVETITLHEYMKGLSKTNQIQLAVAMDLAKKDLESDIRN